MFFNVFWFLKNSVILIFGNLKFKNWSSFINYNNFHQSPLFDSNAAQKILSKWMKVATRGVLSKKVFLEILQNPQENTCARFSFLIKLLAPPATLLKKRLAHVFSCEFCEISKNTFFTGHIWTTASINEWKSSLIVTSYPNSYRFWLFDH